MFLTSLTQRLPADHKRLGIPDGYAGTATTISHMQQLVSNGMRDVRGIRGLALRIIRGEVDGIPAAQDKNYSEYADRIFRFCRDKIFYVFDPYQIELLESPADLVKLGGGDCDSSSMLFCALCQSIGFKCAFRTICSDPRRPNDFSHVYSVVYIPRLKEPVAADATMKDKPFGWEPPTAFCKKQWPASLDNPPEDESMLNGLGYGESANQEDLAEYAYESQKEMSGLGDYRSDLSTQFDLMNSRVQQLLALPQSRTEPYRTALSRIQLAIGTLVGRISTLPDSYMAQAQAVAQSTINEINSVTTAMAAAGAVIPAAAAVPSLLPQFYPANYTTPYAAPYQPPLSSAGSRSKPAKSTMATWWPYIAIGAVAFAGAAVYFKRKRGAQ